MIEFTAATFGFIVNASLVELECLMAGIDGDGNGSNCGHGLLQCLFVALFNIDVASIFSANVLFVESTTTLLLRMKYDKLLDEHDKQMYAYNSFIRIARFSIDSVVFLDVCESKVHQTTVASVVTV